MNITYEQFLKCWQLIAVEGYKLLDDLHAIQPIDGYEYMNLQSWDQYALFFKNEVNRLTFRIPTEALFNTNVRQNLLDKRKKEVACE